MIMVPAKSLSLILVEKVVDHVVAAWRPERVSRIAAII
jgi:hypothetical protein